MFQIQWDEKAIAQANKFLEFRSDWDTFMMDTAEELAKYAEEYFKPMLKGVRNDPKGNGDTERSIQHNIAKTSDGFDITYTGLLSALYLDQGNKPPSSLIYPTSSKVLAVDKRFYGKGMPYARFVHGMGSYTSGAVVHWSDETVKHLDETGAALEIAEKWLNVFLDEVVI